MIIKVDGKELEAEKIIKSKNRVRGYNGDSCVFIVSGENITGEYIEEITLAERLDALEAAMLEFILGGTE